MVATDAGRFPAARIAGRLQMMQDQCSVALPRFETQ